MAKLILGPSGSGKSTLINKRFIGFKNLIFGYELENKKYDFLKFWKKTKISKDSIVHYNILNDLSKQNFNFDEEKFLQNDKLLKKILSYNKLFDEVIILVTPIKELISRATSREKVEDNITDKYDNEFWLNHIKKTNFENLYKELLLILDVNNLKYEILYSSSNDFRKTKKDNIKKNLVGIYE